MGYCAQRAVHICVEQSKRCLPEKLCFSKENVYLKETAIKKEKDCILNILFARPDSVRSIDCKV